MTPKLSVAPLHHPLVPIEVREETHPGIPQLAGGTMLIPVVNDGEVEVTGGHATLATPDEERHADLERIAPGEVTRARLRSPGCGAEL